LSSSLEEGLKPFADLAVMSVARLEMAYNLTRNIPTRAIGARSVACQLFHVRAVHRRR
jgi:hypothetical protein